MADFFLVVVSYVRWSVRSDASLEMLLVTAINAALYRP